MENKPTNETKEPVKVKKPVVKTPAMEAIERELASANSRIESLERQKKEIEAQLAAIDLIKKALSK